MAGATPDASRTGASDGWKKRVRNHEVYEIPRPSRPGPTDEGDPEPRVRELVVVTGDGWRYAFRELVPGEGFRFARKRAPDGRRSACDVVPAGVARYVRETPGLALLAPKTRADAGPDGTDQSSPAVAASVSPTSARSRSSR